MKQHLIDTISNMKMDLREHKEKWVGHPELAIEGNTIVSSNFILIQATIVTKWATSTNRSAGTSIKPASEYLALGKIG